MSKIKLLTKRQLEVIEDLFEAEKKESEILQKHNLSRIVYNKWLEERNFIEEFDKRITAAKNRAAAHFAGSASKAIFELVRLSKGDGETARKACLDIIALQNQVNTEPQPQPDTDEQSNSPESSLSPEAVSRILAALAEENEN